MPVFNIHHITKYEYDRPVKESSNEIKIYPYLCNEQEVLQHDVIITGNPDVHVFTDYWGNRIGLFSVLPSHRLMSIESKLTIRTALSSQLRISFQTGWVELEKEVSVAVGMYYGNIYKIKAFHINNGKKNLLTLKL